MANLDKATRLQAHGLIQHDERSIENHTNEKIDPARSHLNYNLQTGDPWQRYCDRMQQIYCLNRKDVNTLAELSVTIPTDVRPDDQEAFFESCFAFAQDKFGSENIVSAFVHLDETTPHIHIKAIPVVPDKKKGEKVSFKEKCPRSFYQNLHTDLSRRIENDLGYHTSIMNGATLEGNKTIKQLKEETLKEEIRQIDQKAEEIAQAKIEPKQPVKILGRGEMVSYDSYRETVDQISVLSQKNKILERDNRMQRKQIDALNMIVKSWENTKLAKIVEKSKQQIQELKEQIESLWIDNRKLTQKLEDQKDFDFYRGFYDRTVEETARSEDKEWIQENVIPDEYQKQFSKDLQIQESEEITYSKGMSL